jgi:hypothetical protein
VQIRSGGLGWPEAESDDRDGMLGWPEAENNGALGAPGSPAVRGKVEETGETDNGR